MISMANAIANEVSNFRDDVVADRKFVPDMEEISALELKGREIMKAGKDIIEVSAQLKSIKRKIFKMKGLYETPDYIRKNGEVVSNIMTALVDGEETPEILDRAEKDKRDWEIENGLAEPSDEDLVQEGPREEPEDFSGVTYIEGTNNER